MVCVLCHNLKVQSSIGNFGSFSPHATTPHPSPSPYPPRHLHLREGSGKGGGMNW